MDPFTPRWWMQEGRVDTWPRLDGRMKLSVSGKYKYKYLYVTSSLLSITIDSSYTTLVTTAAARPRVHTPVERGDRWLQTQITVVPPRTLHSAHWTLELHTKVRSHGERRSILIILWPSPCLKRQLLLSHLRHYVDTKQVLFKPMVSRCEIGSLEQWL